ncbi:hypothetical protein [Streptomyces sp. BBFR102]|uniref:hypothetical protein n=1 Tax=Streptomyces sp. BBFR102 TaxID=3448171 RepID=UPI003F535110
MDRLATLLGLLVPRSPLELSAFFVAASAHLARVIIGAAAEAAVPVLVHVFAYAVGGRAPRPGRTGDLAADLFGSGVPAPSRCAPDGCELVLSSTPRKNR